MAACGFALHSLTLLMTALFLMGMHSTLFGPVKYAILPQQLAAEELVGGNALIEAGTFVAILIGTIAGGVLVARIRAARRRSHRRSSSPSAVIWLSRGDSLRAGPRRSAAARSTGIPSRETWRNIAFSRSHRTVFLSILGISWFWFYGALFLSQFPAYAKDSAGRRRSAS